MTRILLLGVGPRPSAKAKKIYAPGLRLQSFAESLAGEGHEVHLGELAFGAEQNTAPVKLAATALNESESPEDSPNALAETPSVTPGGMIASETFFAADEHLREAQLEQLIQQINPQAIVTSTDVMGNLAARSAFAGPLFCDFFGHPMAERQMQAAVAKNNGGLLSQWQMVLPILLRADCFGVCSQAQQHALFGELGAVGRLGFETSVHNFAHVLAPANPFNQPFQSTPYSCKGTRIPADALLLLFSGGYNTWLDEETLFKAVERALAQEPRLQYVSTGGGIEGHVTDVFARFMARVEASPFRDRFHFLGWLQHDEYLSLCLEADAGIIVDQPTLEGVYGCRNRLFSWIWAGMRALATDLSESTREVLVPNGFVVPLPMKNAEAIAHIILQETRQGRYSAAETTERQQRLQAVCSTSNCYAGLLEWAADPQIAPDLNSTPAGSNQNALRLSHQQYAALPEVVELIKSLKGSRAFTLFLSTQGDKRLLFEKVCSLIAQTEKQD
ncbi:MAG: hypothetical protein ACFCU1_10435 [Sumerlaeia bacterium]